jgi:hypothetical protein
MPFQKRFPFPESLLSGDARQKNVIFCHSKQADSPNVVMSHNLSKLVRTDDQSHKVIPTASFHLIREKLFIDQ